MQHCYHSELASSNDSCEHENIETVTRGHDSESSGLNNSSN